MSEQTYLRRATDMCATIQSCNAANKAAEDAADVAVKKVFALLGVNVDEPREVEEFRKDLRFGQILRRSAEKSFLALLTAIMVGLVAALWAGIKVNIGH